MGTTITPFIYTFWWHHLVLEIRPKILVTAYRVSSIIPGFPTSPSLQQPSFSSTDCHPLTSDPLSCCVFFDKEACNTLLEVNSPQLQNSRPHLRVRAASIGQPQERADWLWKINPEGTEPSQSTSLVHYSISLEEDRTRWQKLKGVLACMSLLERKKILHPVWKLEKWEISTVSLTI